MDKHEVRAYTVALA